MSELSIESFVSRIFGDDMSSDGWRSLMSDGLNPTNDKTKIVQAVTNYDRMANAAMRLFQTQDGKAVLEWLLNMTLRSPSWYGGLDVNPQQAVHHGFFREGQNSVVALLIGAIRKGQDNLKNATDEKEENNG